MNGKPTWLFFFFFFFGVMIVVENLQDEFKYGNVVLSTAFSLAAE